MNWQSEFKRNLNRILLQDSRSEIDRIWKVYFNLVLEQNIKEAVDLVVNFDRNQPRWPKGHPQGGQWKEKGTGGSYDAKGKQWLGKDGNPLSADDQQRLRSLKTPPGWTDVRLNPDPKAGLQVVGTDSKDRDQPIYTKEHHEQKAMEKWERIRRLNPKIDGITNGSKDRMNDPSLSQTDRDSSAALYLITQTGIRPGSTADTKAEKQAYGATTLEGRHVTIDGNSINVNFTGKKGVRQDVNLSDPGLANYIRHKNTGINDKVFGTTNMRRAMDSVGGRDFSPKDIRTWKGTETALYEVKKLPVPRTKKEFKASVKAVSTKVSEVLGNTPTVALKSYIAPQVFHKWESALNIGK